MDNYIENVYNSLTLREQNRVIALHLIRKSIEETGHAPRTQILADLIKVGTMVYMSGETNLEILTGSSWDELYKIQSNYPYQKYLFILRNI